MRVDVVRRRPSQQLPLRPDAAAKSSADAAPNAQANIQAHVCAHVAPVAAPDSLSATDATAEPDADTNADASAHATTVARANARALHGLANRSDQQANRGARLCPDAAPDTRAVSPANVPSDAGTEPAADGLDANARAVARPDIGPGRFVGDAQGPRRD